MGRDSWLELEEWRLLAYLDGAADAETEQLIAWRRQQDPAFEQRLRHLATVQNRLAIHLDHVVSPTIHELGEYILGLLPPQRAAAIRTYLAENPHRQPEVDALRAYLDIEPDRAPRGAEAPAQTFGGTIQLLVAELLAGLGGNGLALAGIRGEQQEQQIYQAGEAQIILEVKEDPAAPTRRRLIGLLIGVEAPEAIRAHLYRQAQPLEPVEVDDLGNFVIDGLAPATYDLILAGPAQEIHIPNLAI